MDGGAGVRRSHWGVPQGSAPSSWSSSSSSKSSVSSFSGWPSWLRKGFQRRRILQTVGTPRNLSATWTMPVALGARSPLYDFDWQWCVFRCFGCLGCGNICASSGSPRCLLSHHSSCDQTHPYLLIKALEILEVNFSQFVFSIQNIDDHWRSSGGDWLISSCQLVATAQNTQV